MPTCCLYRWEYEPNKGQRFTICTEDAKCPDISGAIKLGGWKVAKCDDCKLTTATEIEDSILGVEINESRVLLAEAQGRLAVLSRLGRAHVERLGQLTRLQQFKVQEEETQ